MRGWRASPEAADPDPAGCAGFSDFFTRALRPGARPLAQADGDAGLATLFDGGQAVTRYLSPRDYHHIHMPCAGRLLRMIHFPGDLFSVNPATVRGVPGLYARNERVICVFDSARGPFVLTLVGATIIGSITTCPNGRGAK